MSAMHRTLAWILSGAGLDPGLVISRVMPRPVVDGEAPDRVGRTARRRPLAPVSVGPASASPARARLIGRISVVLAGALLLSASAFAQPSSTAKPQVWVLATGGTIAGRGASATDLSAYQPGAIAGNELVAAVPQIAQIADVHVEQIANVSSSDLTVQHWLTLAKRINAIFHEHADAAGVVVTHGTNTLEETAYFLNLTVKSDRPVVVVGAMRPATAISADGPLNLLNAVRVAAAPEARGKGALVVMNDEINAARDVTKTNTYRVETFKSPELGLLGYVDEDRVAFYRTSTRRHTTASEFDVARLTELPQVDIIYSSIQPGVDLLRHALDSARGVVMAASGAGSLTNDEQQLLKRRRQEAGGGDIIVVRSSRVGNGRVIERADYADLATIPGDTLNPQKARVLLMLALTRTTDRRVIARMFNEY